MKKIIMIFLLSLVSMTSMTSMAQAQYSEIADGIKPPVYIDVEVVSSEDPTLKLKYQCRTAEEDGSFDGYFQVGIGFNSDYPFRFHKEDTINYVFNNTEYRSFKGSNFHNNFNFIEEDTAERQAERREEAEYASFLLNKLMNSYVVSLSYFSKHKNTHSRSYSFNMEGFKKAVQKAVKENKCKS